MQLRHILILISISFPLSACGQADKGAAADMSPAKAPSASTPAAAAVKTSMILPLLDPNTATEQQLASVAGLSPAGVQSVLTKRPFATPSALHAAISDGMSEQDLRSVYSVMFVKVNLNTAANEDFQLVPSSLSPRKLAHEFDEYRPYHSMGDFSREMKKYVSDEEVANLERYVFID